jgi:uncharacterized damage-inducible protein DinB
MPIAPQIAAAAAMFRQNDALLPKSFAGMTNEEWNRRPNETTNSMLWVVGHMAWSRERTLHFIGGERNTPLLSGFGRGKGSADAPQNPSPEEVVAAWHEVAGVFTAALESATPEMLSAPRPEKGPPSIDGMVGGIVSFMAYHETYHFGQAAYISRWLGHAQIMG